MKGMVIYKIFWPSPSNKNSMQYLLRTDILQKTVVKYTRDFFKTIFRDLLLGIKGDQ